MSNTIGGKINLILARMEMVSEGKTQRPFDVVMGGGENDFRTGSLADEWKTLLERLLEAMIVELGRAKGEREYRIGVMDSTDKDARIKTIYPHRPARFVSWVEDVPESIVRKLRQEWKEQEAA